jgi:hypothetical protein
MFLESEGVAKNMDPNQLYVIVGFIAALSVASERLVDIVKGFIPALNTKSLDDAVEARRQAYIQILAIVGGMATSWVAWPVTQKALPLGELPSWLVIVGLGLLASCGSGFWNSIQSYLNLLKSLKGMTVKEEKRKLAGQPPPGNP